MAREEGTGSLSVTGLRWGLAGGSCHSSVFSVLGEFDVHKLCVRGAKAIRAVPGTECTELSVAAADSRGSYSTHCWGTEAGKKVFSWELQLGWQVIHLPCHWS